MKNLPPLLQKLTGGDRRSTGRVEEVVAEVLAKPKYFRLVFEGMLAEDPLVRMRAADAVEKISLQHPEYLRPFNKETARASGPQRAARSALAYGAAIFPAEMDRPGTPRNSEPTRRLFAGSKQHRQNFCHASIGRHCPK